MMVYEIKDLVKVYPGRTQPANSNIYLSVRQGEIFGLLGDNGAGKTTLVRQMVNLLRPTSGRIVILGQEVGDDPLRIPMNVGYMPQDAAAANNLTVGEALYFSAHLRGMPRRAAQNERDRLLAMWKIEHLKRKVGQKLSGGEQRLMQLALAMAGSPPVLILDEPTNNLDPQRRQQVWGILREMNQKLGTTIIFITHDAIEAEKTIQRVGIMRCGELVALGRPIDLKEQVDQKLRLEIFTADDKLPLLPSGLTARRLDAGRWMVYVERRDADRVFKYLESPSVDDFRLYSTTLEDLYLYYVNQTKTAGTNESAS